MPKYYCDYCDTFLTHDSPSVRKTHCNGRKHRENVRFYYQKWMEEQAQNLIDVTTAAFKANKALIPPALAFKPLAAGLSIPGVPPGIRFPPGPPPPTIPIASNRLPIISNATPGAALPPGAPLPPGAALPPGATLPPGTALPPGATLPPGTALPPGATLPPGTALPPGATLPPGTALPPGALPPRTAIPSMINLPPQPPALHSTLANSISSATNSISATGSVLPPQSAPIPPFDQH
ncbi:DNA repair protein RAD51 4-like [Sarcoptes scabiei]|nr:DNA repair protein RAD51 4-like [Sarcoptes scabiei]